MKRNSVIFKTKELFLFCLKTFPCFFQGETRLCDTFLSNISQTESRNSTTKLRIIATRKEIGLLCFEKKSGVFLMVVAVGAVLQSSIVFQFKIISQCGCFGHHQPKFINPNILRTHKHSHFTSIGYVSRSFSLFQP